MNWLFGGLAVWALYTFAVHTFGGQRLVVRPMLRAGLPRLSQGTLHVVWHIVTMDLVFSVAGLGALAMNLVDLRWAFYLGVHAFGCAGIFVLIGQRAGAAIRLPQWLLLAPLGLTAVTFGAFGHDPARAAMLACAALLSVIASVHLGWALGGRWPAASLDEMYAAFVGATPSRKMPGRLATLLVGVALAGLAALVARRQWWGLFATLVLFGARGVVGFFERRLRPAINGTLYARLSLIFYTPLCLAIAALALGGLMFETAIG
jgi:hypothetical protein